MSGAPVVLFGGLCSVPVCFGPIPFIKVLSLPSKATSPAFSCKWTGENIPSNEIR